MRRLIEPNIDKEKQIAHPANDPARMGLRPPPNWIVGWPPVIAFRKVNDSYIQLSVYEGKHGWNSLSRKCGPQKCTAPTMTSPLHSRRCSVAQYHGQVWIPSAELQQFETEKQRTAVTHKIRRYISSFSTESRCREAKLIK
jgi:hypothetical protein